MISTVLCGRFYKIFVSPMLHKKSSASAGLFLCSKQFPPAAQVLPLSGAGVIFGGGPAPQNGLLRAPVAQVPIL